MSGLGDVYACYYGNEFYYHEQQEDKEIELFDFMSKFVIPKSIKGRNGQIIKKEAFTSVEVQLYREDGLGNGDVIFLPKYFLLFKVEVVCYPAYFKIKLLDDYSNGTNTSKFLGEFVHQDGRTHLINGCEFIKLSLPEKKAVVKDFKRKNHNTYSWSKISIFTGGAGAPPAGMRRDKSVSVSGHNLSEITAKNINFCPDDENALYAYISRLLADFQTITEKMTIFVFVAPGKAVSLMRALRHRLRDIPPCAEFQFFERQEIVAETYGYPPFRTCVNEAKGMLIGEKGVVQSEFHPGSPLLSQSNQRPSWWKRFTCCFSRR